MAAAPAQRVRRAGTQPVISRERQRAVAAAVAKSGLLSEKSARIAARVSPALIAEARRLTGITSDTELIEYALATLAVEDPFLDAFDAVKGTVDPDIALGY